MKKDLLKIDSLTKEQILDILNLADQLKYELKHGIAHPHLQGKTLGMIFEKASTRTRVSFETGMYQLGGNALFLSYKDLQAERGEIVEDTARTLSRYVQGILIRTFSQTELETFAKYATVPVINGLTNEEHPCQVLADLMTIRENKNILEGLKVAFIGDGHNMANSLVTACLKIGMNFSIASPEQYRINNAYIKRAQELAEKENVKFEYMTSPEEAVKNADVVITDVWTSMDQEAETEKRLSIFKNYQVNSNLLKLADENAIVLHCLPCHREQEITSEIMDEFADIIFDETENRLHVQKAILVKLLK